MCTQPHNISEFLIYFFTSLGSLKIQVLFFLLTLTVCIGVRIDHRCSTVKLIISINWCRITLKFKWKRKWQKWLAGRQQNTTTTRTATTNGSFEERSWLLSLYMPFFTLLMSPSHMNKNERCLFHFYWCILVLPYFVSFRRNSKNFFPLFFLSMHITTTRQTNKKTLKNLMS